MSNALLLAAKAEVESMMLQIAAQNSKTGLKQDFSYQAPPSLASLPLPMLLGAPTFPSMTPAHLTLPLANTKWLYLYFAERKCFRSLQDLLCCCKFAFLHLFCLKRPYSCAQLQSVSLCCQSMLWFSFFFLDTQINARTQRFECKTNGQLGQV